MNFIEFTQFSYSDDTSGRLHLYLFDARGYHRGALWVEQQPRDDEERAITVAEARRISEAHMLRGFEVRITNSGDHMVYRAVCGKVEYPPDPEKFWEGAAR